MTDMVSVESDRVRAEIMLIQQALGVQADGVIGPETRRAARRVYEQRHRSQPDPEDDYADRVTWNSRR